MVKLEITEQQAGALLQLLDISVKTGGLNVAEAGVFFSKLIQAQLTPVEGEAAAEETAAEEVAEEDVTIA